MTHLRDAKGRLLPGQPPLPGAGRPPVADAVRAEVNRILAEATPHASRRLVELMDNPDPKVALAASELVLARVFGKPVAPAEVKVTQTNVQTAHLQILMELQAKHDDAQRQVKADHPSRVTETIEAVEVPATSPAAPDEEATAGSAAMRA